MQGLVLVAGEGTRLRPLTFSVPKQLISLLGKPVVQYVIEDLRDAGIRDIGIVVGYLGWLFREVLGDGSGLGVRLRYVVQERRLGIAHAIHRAIEEDVVRGSFVVYLGDNVLSDGVRGHVEWFREEGSDVHILLARVRDPRRFGVAVVEGDRVVRLVEKPREPPSDLALVGVYFFRDPDLVEKAFKSLKPSWRGEYEVTELIQWFIEHGYRVSFGIVNGWWKDIGTRESLLEGARLLLDRVRTSIRGEVSGEIEGRVVVEEGAVVEGRVYGPAYIGRGARVAKGVTVEPYTSLEAGSRVDSGLVARSLLLEESVADMGRARLVDSVLGRRARVTIRREIYGDVRLFVSDYSLVEI